ncbi:hypothetical protein PYW08_010035 [Mythimna loreyi]|uniref:Uncharacterized protein n=1 Tax=Mythimna loreyi TaxID=667449 RepID=A0ACC2QAA2_9NEOP|nr:hypothetical protein PYW08_010035 [Mythimna loreyi]
MYLKGIVSILVLYLAIAECNDIRMGYASPRSKKIYGEIKEASPTLWRRSDEVIVNAPINEVIEAVYVTDLREYKDGVASIVSGGVGQKSVTISLRSPTILRGYRFEIEVFAHDPNLGYFSKGAQYLDTQFARKF